VTSPRASEDSGAGEPGADEPPGPDTRESSEASAPREHGSPTPEHGTPEQAPAEPAPAEQDDPRPATGIRWATGETPAHGTATTAEPTAPPDEEATPPSGLPTAGYPQGAPSAGPPTWQQTAPGWAPPPAATPRDPARRRRIRRIGLAVVLGLVVIAAVVVALLAFLVGPRFARYDVLDRAAVERGVTDVVTRDWHRQVTGTVCPADERVRPGTSFVCTATVDGRPQQIPVDVVDENGTYEVGQPR
jgi:hypothetical protein